MQGEVKLDGEPVNDGSISFYSTTGDERIASSIEGGKYKISISDRFPPGTYRVEVSWLKPTGRKIASREPGIMSDEKQEVIPAQYNSQSTLTKEIKAGDNQYDFLLTTK